jgi:predicted transcriptional regulator
VRGFGELGALEAAVMEAVWRQDEPVTVRQVVEGLAGERDLAYTTVLTVMDNLHRKGFLEREMVGRAYSYRPSVSRDAYTARLMRDALHESGDQKAALSHFVEGMSQEESALLRAVLRRRPRR